MTFMRALLDWISGETKQRRRLEILNVSHREIQESDCRKRSAERDEFERNARSEAMRMAHEAGMSGDLTKADTMALAKAYADFMLKDAA